MSDFKHTIVRLTRKLIGEPYWEYEWAEENPNTGYLRWNEGYILCDRDCDPIMESLRLDTPGRWREITAHELERLP